MVRPHARSQRRAAPWALHAKGHGIGAETLADLDARSAVRRMPEAEKMGRDGARRKGLAGVLSCGGELPREAGRKQGLYFGERLTPTIRV